MFLAGKIYPVHLYHQNQTKHRNHHEKAHHQLKPICAVSYTGIICHDYGRKLPG
jgi:hypothetical protein